MTSKNPLAEEIMGLRSTVGLAIDFPAELGFVCPNKGKTHHLEWSEYRGFIWCEQCDVDYPSCLCVPDLSKATTIFLISVKEVLNES